MPPQVNLNATDLNGHIDSVLSCAFCQVKAKGSSCQVNVANTALSRSKNLENIRVAIEKVAEGIPGGVANLKSLHLRTVDSPALPIYVTFKSPADVELPTVEKEEEKEEAEDVTPLEGYKVVAKGNADFKIVKDKKKKNAQKEATSESCTVVRKGKRKASESDLENNPPKVAAMLRTGKRKACEGDSEHATKSNKALIKKGKTKVRKQDAENSLHIVRKAQSIPVRKGKRKASDSEVEISPPKKKKTPKHPISKFSTPQSEKSKSATKQEIAKEETPKQKVSKVVTPKQKASDQGTLKRGTPKSSSKSTSKLKMHKQKTPNGVTQPATPKGKTPKSSMNRTPKSTIPAQSPKSLKGKKSMSKTD